MLQDVGIADQQKV